MFCPEGYVTIPRLYDFAFRSIFDHLFDAAKVEWRQAGSASLGDEANEATWLVPPAPRGELSAPAWLACPAPADEVEAALFRAIADELCISSPDGHVIRLDLQAAKRAMGWWNLTIIDLADAAEVRADAKPIAYNFLHMNRLFSWSKQDFLSMFQEVLSGQRDDTLRHFGKDHDSCTLWDFAKEMQLHHLHQQVPLFYERRGFTISFETYEHVKRLEIGYLEPWADVVRILKPFEGWAMCIRREVADGSSWKEALRQVAADEEAERRKGGRPGKQEKARIAYQILYPRGHGGIPWKEMIRALERQAGDTLSEDTVRRALRLR